MVRLIPGDSERAGYPSPVLSCATRGFHCLLGYPWSGGLLPHHFTLTQNRVGPGAVCFLLHFPSERLEPVVPCYSQGALPYGVRTFLYVSCDTQRSSGERRIKYNPDHKNAKHEIREYPYWPLFALGFWDFKPRNTCMSHILTTYAHFPLTAVRGEGARLWDSEGNCYLDFCAGIATCSIGHCHPVLTQAITAQCSTLMHCSNLFRIPQQEELARMIVEDYMHIPGKVFFANSGAEANDGMIKTARRFGHARPNKAGQPRYEVITFNNSFHGRTLGSMAATAQSKIQQGFDPMLPGFRYVALNDSDGLRAAVSDITAGIMLEPIQGEGGVNEVTPEFLEFVQHLCKENDLLLMLDEVQCGLGRTGTLNGWQAFCPDLEPDTVSWAKSLGGGFPIGAFFTSDRAIDDGGTPLSSLMNAGSHGSTYGGNPLACAASLSVLGEILTSDLAANAARQEQRIRQEVHTWDQPAITGIRGKGLLIGFALNAEAMACEQGNTPALQLCKSLMKNGLLTVPAGAETLRWVPPLNVTDSEIDEALGILKETLTSL